MSMELKDKKIVLGLTGGVACYKAAELCRALVKGGASVQVVMSEAATHFIGTVTMQALSGQPVFTDQWDPRMANNMAHIDLTREADAILIAPCSADFMRKLAHGAADDLLSTLCVARPRRVPLLVAPAMNVEMWENPATQRNVKQLQEDGICLFGPAAGSQACGETGLGRMLEADELVEELVASFQHKVLAGRRVLITAGPTFEPIDPVRGITNLSSGKMGYAVARAAREAGAEVTLVSGPTALPTPHGVRRIDVLTAQQMHDVVMAGVEGQHVSSASLPWPTGAWRMPASKRSRRRREAARRSWSSSRTPTSWPPSPPPPPCPAGPTASASPPNPATGWNSARPSARKKEFPCWWAISARRPSGRMTTPSSCSTKPATPCCRAPTS
eukprot:TRINITY_DN11864_c0_g1_i1.p1 TRINITY_DN11864_c0_g1~~TRINITY_DN11864_c0_g1_i1.p1  ORF type:complete len:387 (+),score=58.88 TRINITY_DN11864_c0_g1_i1:809-1969(+)